MPPGTYTVTARFLGYATEQRADVVVAAGQTVRVDLELRTEVLSLSEWS